MPTLALITLAIGPATGEELSKYSVDDPQGARAVWKLGVVGLELGDCSTDNLLTTVATSLASALRAFPAVV